VITDGARWSDRMLALCRDGHMRLTVSLDHASPALNSRSRDPRAFGQAMALVERARAMGLPVRANAVVSAYNYKDARAILSFLSEQGIAAVEFILFHAPRPVEFSLSAGMLHEFLTNLVPLQLEFAHLAIENVRSVYTRTFLSPRSDCGGGTHVIKALPGRRVKPCSFSDVEEMVPEGRSLTEYFRQPGPGFEALRRRSVLDDPECRNCDLRFLCGGGCPVRATSATPACGCAKELYWRVLFERPRLEPLNQRL
jgi:radical SAM protein with 4Fe4S-binding SPASM domain